MEACYEGNFKRMTVISEAINCGKNESTLVENGGTFLSEITGLNKCRLKLIS